MVRGHVAAHRRARSLEGGHRRVDGDPFDRRVVLEQLDVIRVDDRGDAADEWMLTLDDVAVNLERPPERLAKPATRPDDDSLGLAVPFVHPVAQRAIQLALPGDATLLLTVLPALALLGLGRQEAGREQDGGGKNESKKNSMRHCGPQ